MVVESLAYTRGSCIEAILNQLLHYGAKINDDLTGLYLMYLLAHKHQHVAH